MTTRPLARVRPLWPLLPAVVLLAGVLLVPLIAIFWTSISTPTFGLQHYIDLFTDELTLKVIGRTAVTAATVTAVTLILGYPYAYAMTRVGPRLRSLLLAVVLVPFWTSMIARTFAWLILLQNGGPIQRGFAFFGLDSVVLYGTQAGVTVAMCQVLLPYVVLPLFASLGAIDRRLLLAARGLGSSRIRAFWKVYWPLSRNGAIAGAILVFTLSCGFYVAPALLGSPQQSMIAQLLGQRATQFLDFAGAGALGTVVLILTLALVAWANRLGSRVTALGVVTDARAGL